MLIQVKRGLQENVQNLVLKEGELAVALDTGNVYIGTTAGNHHVNPTGGIADTAKKLQTPRNFSITGDGTSSTVSFDGTDNVSLKFTLADIGGLEQGTYTKLTVDSKGRVTAGGIVRVSDIEGIGAAASKGVGTSPGNLPELDSQGKLNTSVLPALAISETSVVNTQAKMLALTAQTGDVCVRTDLNTSFILTQSPASTLENWQELLTPDGAVKSVAGKTGIVQLVKADVGLGNVDNTADKDKSVNKANSLTTGRRISLTGGATATGVAFDGTKDIVITVSDIDGDKITGIIDGGTF